VVSGSHDQASLDRSSALVPAFKVEACSSGAYLSRVARLKYVCVCARAISVDRNEFQNYRSN